MLHDLSGKTVKRARAFPNSCRANMPDGTEKHGNTIILEFTDGTEFSCGASADTMNVVWCVVQPKEIT